MKYVLKLTMFLAALGIMTASCSTDNSDEGVGFSVKLVDAPGDYDKVLVDVQAIEVKLEEETIQIPVKEPGIYDLLELTGGVSAMLVETVLPAGQLNQIRLILGENNSVVSGGDTLSLKTPSAQQSGLKINVNEELKPGLLYEFILDFNVDKSIVDSGKGQGLILKPVIRATLAAESGAISGSVIPAEVQSLVTATADSTEVAAYSDMETGAFLLYGVPSGTYTVTITPDSTSGKSPMVIDNVKVEKGEVKDLGGLNLE